MWNKSNLSKNDTENRQMRNKTLQEKLIYVQSSMYEYTTYYLFYSRNQWLYWAESEFNRIQWCHSLLVRAEKQVGSKSQLATENLCGSVITLGHPRINEHALFFSTLVKTQRPKRKRSTDSLVYMWPLKDLGERKRGYDRSRL